MRYPFKRIVIDIQNYMFLKKAIKKNEKSVEWERFKLRSDWICRIYTVINLPPEVIHSPDSPEEIRPAFILEEAKPLNEYLMKLNLSEIIIPEIGAIPDTVSYLVLYKPYFQRLSWRWIILRVIGIIGVLVLNSYFSIFAKFGNLISTLYEFIF